MGHIAFLSRGNSGHVLQVCELARQLRERGHETTLIAPPAAEKLAGQWGLKHYPLTAERVRGRALRLSLEAAIPVAPRFAQLGLLHEFCYHAHLTLQCAPAALQELQVDGVVVDQNLTAAGTVAEHLGLPFVTLCTALLWHEGAEVPPHYTGWPYATSRWARLCNRSANLTFRAYMRPVLAVINRQRRRWGLKPHPHILSIFSPLAQISQLCPELDFPHPELPRSFHYVGALSAQRALHDPAFPWERLDGKPLVFASMGTVPNRRNAKVLRCVADACKNLPVQVVVTAGNTGRKRQETAESIGPLPENTLAVSFAPQLELLERTALLVTHGGVNTVLESLSKAVPMIVLPRAADQPAMAARVAYAGAGLVDSFRRVTADRLRGRIRQILENDRFRKRASDLQAALHRAGGAVRAAEIIEQAISTRRPVLHS